MAKRNINIGATANDRSGDLIRTAFQKVNDNFTELYAGLPLLSVGPLPPDGPHTVGEQWWDSTDGNSYIWYDGNWVPSTASVADQAKNVRQNSGNSINIDFQADGIITTTLNSDITVAFSNYTVGARVRVIVSTDSSSRYVTLGVSAGQSSNGSTIAQASTIPSVITLDYICAGDTINDVYVTVNDSADGIPPSGGGLPDYLDVNRTILNGNKVIFKATDSTVDSLFIGGTDQFLSIDKFGAVALQARVDSQMPIILQGASSTLVNTEKPITDVSLADPVVITVVGHGLNDNDKVYINGFASTVELNATSYYVYVLDADSFELYSDRDLQMPVDGAGFTAFDGPDTGTITSAPEGGDIYINAGANSTGTNVGDSGIVNIYGQNVNAGADRTVSVVAGAYEWDFTNDGKLHLPLGGDIVDSTGTSVLGGAGSGTIWTNDANGCLRVELSSTGFQAFTDGSHADLQDGGLWNIGSYQNNTTISNDGFANPRDLWLRSGSATYISTDLDSSEYGIQWMFSGGSLTFPNGSTIGSADAVVGVPITTTRGTVLFGNQPENCEPVTGASHFHIMKSDPTNVDLFFGDDFNYVKLPGNGETAYGVEIGTNVGSAYTWRFGTDGKLTFPTTVADPVGRTTQAFGMGNLFAWNDGGSNWAIGTADPTTGAFGGASITISPGIESNGSLYIPHDAVANTNALVLANNNTGGVQIISNTSTWTFGADGTTTVPGKIWAKASDNGSISFSDNGVDEHGYIKVDAGLNMVINADGDFSIKKSGSDRISITTNAIRFTAGGKSLSIGNDGRVTLPENFFFADIHGSTILNKLSYFTNDLEIDANTLTGTTLNSGITSSSLTSVGTLTGLTSSGVVHITNTEDSTNADTGSLQVDGGAHITKNLIAEGTIYAGKDAYSEALTNPLMVASSPSNVSGGYSQVAILNNSANASGDYQVFVDGYDVNVSDTGWSDLGYAGSNFSDARYTITQPGDGYVFVSGLAGSTNGGSLVLATDGSGTTNDIVFATGGFTTDKERMRISDADGSITITGELKSASGTGDVVIEANDGTARTWTFGGAGNLVLPAGGDIKDSNGASVLGANPFNQSLNTTNSATFKTLTVTPAMPGVVASFNGPTASDKLVIQNDGVGGNGTRIISASQINGQEAPLVLQVSGLAVRSYGGGGTYKQYSFNANGDFVLPAGGDIKDSNGASVISGAYTLPTASDLVLGGVKVDGTTITITDGVISSTGGTGGYSLPTASTTTLGGVKVDGTTITIDDVTNKISAVIPTNISHFTNDSGYLTSVTNITGNAGTVTNGVYTSGSYADPNWITSLAGSKITGNVAGNAATATKLATARNINGVAFDGTGDITVTAAASTLTGNTLNSGITGSSLTSVGTLVNLTVTNAITGSVTGAAGNAPAGTLTGTTLNSTVVSSSLTSVGTLANLTVTNPIVGTVQNGIVSTGSYANPAWITSLAYSKLTGTPTGLVTTADTGTVTNTMLAGSIANAKLANSSITIGTTAIALGASSTTLAGLTGVTSSGNIAVTGTGKFSGDGSLLTNVTVSNASNIVGTGTNVNLVAGSYTWTFDTTGLATLPGTTTSTGTITSNATNAFIASGSAVNNVALGLQATAGTAANMAIRDSSTVASTIYYDTSTGAAVNGQHMFRTGSGYTTLATIGQYGIALPTRPAFRVYGAGTTTNLTTTANTNGILNSNNFAVDYQQGTALTTSTGIFTAPVAGLYSVHLVARVSNTASAQIAVVKNYASSGPVQAMWECGANCTANHFGVSSIAKLAAGDTLVIKVLLGQINFDGNDSWAVAYIG